MKKIQQALGPTRLQPDAGGLYMYGEAWDFGEVRLGIDISRVHALTQNDSKAVFPCKSAARLAELLHVFCHVSAFTD